VTEFAPALDGKCPDCGVAVGQQHDPSCDVARCPACGGQRLGCDCKTRRKAAPWSGTWPGEKEAAAFGWYCVLTSDQGWKSCDKDTPGAKPDLNRLITECLWNPCKQAWEDPSIDHKTCKNCNGAVDNEPFSNRLYCNRGEEWRTAVGRNHTCKFFEQKL
jgi:hypothetical protein